MKNYGWIVKLVAAVLAVAAVVTLVVVFRDEIAAFFKKLKEKCPICKGKTAEEAEAICEDFADFADV